MDCICIAIIVFSCNTCEFCWCVMQGEGCWGCPGFNHKRDAWEKTFTCASSWWGSTSMGSFISQQNFKSCNGSSNISWRWFYPQACLLMHFPLHFLKLKFLYRLELCFSACLFFSFAFVWVQLLQLIVTQKLLKSDWIIKVVLQHNLSNIHFLWLCLPALNNIAGFLRDYWAFPWSKVSFPCLFYLVISGATFTRLWLGESNDDSNIVPLAILFKSTSVCMSELSN